MRRGNARHQLQLPREQEVAADQPRKKEPRPSVSPRAYATIATKGFGWLWNLGGIEYLVFWCLASFALAVQGWQRERQASGALSLFGRAAPRAA
jgi:hypothetical protein